LKCLIPVHQESFPKNSIKRADSLCDEVEILYVLDKKIIEKVEDEASYILPTHAIENLEEFVINMHKQEAEKTLSEFKRAHATVSFVVGEFYESVAKAVLKSAPDMIMQDSFMRGLLSVNAPLWVDSGKKIKECCMFISSVKMLARTKKNIEFAEELCRRLNSKLYIYYVPGDEAGLSALRPLGNIVDRPRGELYIMSREHHIKVPRKKAVLIL